MFFRRKHSFFLLLFIIQLSSSCCADFLGSIPESINKNVHMIIEKLYDPSLDSTNFNNYLSENNKKFLTIWRNGLLVEESKEKNNIFTFLDANLFINNYKCKDLLSEDERDLKYKEELQNYNQHKLKDAIFFLHKNSFKNIVSGETYNFVMLDTKTLVFSSSDPISFSLISADKIVQPNHTILAKGKKVLTAGNFRMFENDNKKVLFISNQSGHYAPTYESLLYAWELLGKVLNINEYAIHLIPYTLDYEVNSRKEYSNKKIIFELPVVKRVYVDRHEYWEQNLDKQIVTAILQKIVSNNPIKKEEVFFLKEERRRAVYLRVALFIANESHLVDKHFHNYVSTFGHLIDLLMANIENIDNLSNLKNKDLIFNLTEKLLKIIQRFDLVFSGSRVVNFANRENLEKYYTNNYKSLLELVNKKALPIKKFHKFRNIFKLYLALFQSSQPYYPNSNIIKSATERLKNLVIKMGEINDEHTTEFYLTGRKKKMVVLSPEMYNEIREIVFTVLTNVSFKDLCDS